MSLLEDLQAIDLSAIVDARAAIRVALEADDLQALIEAGAAQSALGEFGSVLGNLQQAVEDPVQFLEPIADAIGEVVSGVDIDGLAGSELVEAITVAVEPTARTTSVWQKIPDFGPSEAPVALRIRAVKGRFYWVGVDQPSLRLVVRDDSPQATPLRLNGSTVVDVAGQGAERRGLALPTAAFAGANPVLTSDLFLTVDVGELTLRYAR